MALARPLSILLVSFMFLLGLTVGLVGPLSLFVVWRDWTGRASDWWLALLVVAPPALMAVGIVLGRYLSQLLFRWLIPPKIHQDLLARVGRLRGRLSTLTIEKD
jgi:hypothetical protein